MQLFDDTFNCMTNITMVEVFLVIIVQVMFYKMWYAAKRSNVKSFSEESDKVLTT